jgi:hypothetical protein
MVIRPPDEQRCGGALYRNRRRKRLYNHMALVQKGLRRPGPTVKAAGRRSGRPPARPRRRPACARDGLAGDTHRAATIEARAASRFSCYVAGALRRLPYHTRAPVRASIRPLYRKRSPGAALYYRRRSRRDARLALGAEAANATARDGNRYTLPSRAPASFMLLIPEGCRGTAAVPQEHG